MKKLITNQATNNSSRPQEALKIIGVKIYWNLWTGVGTKTVGHSSEPCSLTGRFRFQIDDLSDFYFYFYIICFLNMCSMLKLN